MLLTLTAERIYRSKQSERYRLTITGTDYSLVLQTNRPAVEEKKNTKTVQWHIVEGVALDKDRLENVYKQLEISIDKHPSFIQGTLNFINHF